MQFCYTTNERGRLKSKLYNLSHTIISVKELLTFMKQGG